MLNTIRITTNQLEHIQTNLCIHLSYPEDQRNLKIYIYNKEKMKKKNADKSTHKFMDNDRPTVTPHLISFILTREVAT